MAKYIELDVAKKAFQNMDAGRKHGSTLLTPEEFAEYLDELPFADVVPVRIGFWIPIYESELTGWNPEFAGCDPIAGWQCSLCRYDVMLSQQSNYCSQCGAQMEVWEND